MEPIISIAVILLLLVAVLGVFTGLVWFGFRMGRRTVDKPMAPVVKAKQQPFVEEDPYAIPMYGSRAGNTPTMEGR